MLRRLFDSSAGPEVAGEQYLIVGLGNPGREYRETRHNMGFMAVDVLAGAMQASLTRVQSKALIGQGSYMGKRVILAKPQTFMNLSGQAVSSLVRFYKIPLERLLVIHDDIDLPFGTLRMRPDGGAGGQKGLASIITQLGTKTFPRLRLGVGRPPGRMEAAGYVLQEFSAQDKELLGAVFERARDAVAVYLQDGLEKAMTQYNGELTKGKG
jgi:peptidyl-tRNA hydrolase, PTH1 family